MLTIINEWDMSVAVPGLSVKSRGTQTHYFVQLSWKTAPNRENVGP